MGRLILLLVMLGGCASGTPIQGPPDNALTVVFDIDGTLTPRPLEFLEVRADAAEAATLFSQKGYHIIYLSARLGEFKSDTREWLKAERFPAGSIYLAESDSDVAHPDKFKIRMLLALAGKGWRLGFAYGDLPTDFTAYAAAPIPPQHVFALRHEGAKQCQKGQFAACLSSWSEHLPFVEQQPPAK